jgi:CrcB protein
MLELLGVMLGGALGAAARFLLGLQIQAATGALFPYGTLTVNVLGCLGIGLITESAGHTALLPEGLRVPLVVGVLGAFTTYSAFGYESLRLVRDGWGGIAFAYVVATTVLGFGAVWVGMLLARAALRI